ncbi:MAG: Xaa-Pro peptidase family protein [Patescibacteria group bacterium]|nr:Xaa-Pro peptidase family protein [Patescibacteria group bacterium]
MTINQSQIFIDPSQLLEANHLDGFLVTNFYNILYLTGFKGSSSEERDAWVLVTKEEFFLFTDKRYQGKVRKNNQSLKVIIFEEGKGIVDYLDQFSKEKKIKRVGFEAEDLRFLEYQKLSSSSIFDLVPFSNLIKKHRAKKTLKEIEKINQASLFADKCLDEIKKILKVGITEREIVYKIESWLKKRGLEVGFFPIVAVDEHSAIPHYDPRESEGVIRKNSVLLIDFGVKYQNYNCDITRIFFIDPDSEKINVYQKLIKIYERLINFFSSSKPKTYKEVGIYSRKLFETEKLPQMPHSLGHGVGLEIHEYPKVSFLSEDKIEDCQVFTIEPGVYFQGKWGMRVEDTVVFEEKIKFLTKFPKNLVLNLD